LNSFKDSIKTCYNEVNVVLAEAKECVQNLDPRRAWAPLRMGINDPSKVLPYFAH